MKVLGHKTSKGRVCNQHEAQDFLEGHGGDITSLDRMT